MLDRADWLELAKALPIGGKASHEHSCGSGNKLLVEHKPDGWAAWCYRCNEPGWVPHPEPSFADRMARLRRQEAQESSFQARPSPPTPMNFDASSWPPAARVWLYSVGLSNQHIKSLGIYWNSAMERVVIPVLDGPQVIYWQARTFDKDRPKYINPVCDKPMYKAGTGPLLVLTEDILSAIKVGFVTQAWGLLGTALSPSMASQIVQTGKPVAIWLDPDGAGVYGRRKMVKELRAMGCDTRIIRTERDPKYYSRQQIKEILHIT